ncbi:hypothetical protein EDD22DRAFT_876317, partial [Suillus occidentalis]
ELHDYLTLSTPSNRTLTSVRKPVGAERYARREETYTPQAIVLPPTKSLVFSSPKLSHAPGASRGWRALGNGEGREGTVKRHGIRGLVTRFPVTFAIVSAATFSISLLVLAACILPAIQWRFPNEDDGSGELTEEIVKERIYRKRRQRRKLSPREYKIEDVPIDMPPAVTFSDQPLRRRRSRGSDVFYDSEP